MDNGVKQETTELGNGKIVLKMNKIYGILGIASMIISVIIIDAIVSGVFISEDGIYALGMIALFFLLGLPLVLYSRNIMVEAAKEKN